MAQPSPYIRQFNFQNFQANAPTTPLPAVQVDAEFNTAKLTLDEILNNLALIQRDDGALANGSVGQDQYASENVPAYAAPTVADYVLVETSGGELKKTRWVMLPGVTAEVDLGAHLLSLAVPGSLDAEAAPASGDKFVVFVDGAYKVVDVDDLPLDTEAVQDVVGGMFSGNTETLITATYQDADGTIDLVVDDDLANYDNTTSGFLDASDIGTTVQAYDADLDTWAGLSPSANAQSLVTAADYAAMRALLDLEAGTDFYSIAAADAAFEAADADTLKADVGDTLTAGFLTDSFAGGTQSSGTYTSAPGTGQENFQHIVNGGAFTLAPPASPCNVVIQVTNNASAGAITTSGFTIVTGDTITTTDADVFLFYITRSNDHSHLNVVALQ